MGRYDKIRVYDGSQWRTPTQIKVYHNGWQDLDTATSYSTKPLYVYDSDLNLKRVTLNRRDYTTVVDQYTVGQFTLKPASGYCYATNSNNVGKFPWDLNVTIRKTQAEEQQIFWCGTKTSGSYIRVRWLANGKISVDNRWDGNSVDTVTTPDAVSINTWHTLRVYTPKGSSTVQIWVDGVKVATGTLNNFFQIINATTKVGDTYINFKNNFKAAGCKYSNKAYTCEFNASTANGTGSNTADYQNVTHYAETQSHTVYE